MILKSFVTLKQEEPNKQLPTKDILKFRMKLEMSTLH